MDEKLSYKEFLDRNESWPMDDRDLCLEAQPAFQPVPMGALRSTPPFHHWWDTTLSQLCPSGWVCSLLLTPQFFRMCSVFLNHVTS